MTKKKQKVRKPRVIEEGMIINRPYKHYHSLRNIFIFSDDGTNIGTTCMDIKGKALILTLVSTGMRIGEALEIKKDDVDFNLPFKDSEISTQTYLPELSEPLQIHRS